MPLKDLMVHLDRSERAKTRLDMAVAIARAHQARLVGVFGQRAQAYQVGIVAHWPSDEYVQAAATSKAEFQQACAGLAQAEWRDINRGSDPALLSHIAAAARYTDLMILGQHDGSSDSHVPSELPEEVLANAGRPILVVPYAGSFAPVFKRPLIAWNDSREAAHALNDALPLIEGCDEAVVLSLDTRHEEAKANCAAVVDHLTCHGIAATSEALVVQDIGIMDMLLSRLADHGADLLVMGGHSQIGFPFLSRGAGTRHILSSMTVPVLLAS